MLPVFSRRSPPQGEAKIELLGPIACVQPHTRYLNGQWLTADPMATTSKMASMVNGRPTSAPIVNPTTSRLVMPIKAQENIMYEVPIQFQCRCCRKIWGGYFHYLSWELPDNWRMNPRSEAHLVISRDDYLCKYCRTGDGLPGFSLDQAIFCKCVGSAIKLSKIHKENRAWNGWVVDNPDMPDHTDATLRRYMKKQYRRHNDEKDRCSARYPLPRPKWAQQRAPERPMMSTENEGADYPPIGYALLMSMGQASIENPDLPE